MKVTRRQLRNLINEVLNEQGVDVVDSSRKEKAQKLFLHLNQVGKSEPPADGFGVSSQWLKFTFSLSDGWNVSNPERDESTDNPDIGEIHFIGDKHDQEPVGERVQISKRMDRAREVLAAFNRKHKTQYEVRHFGGNFLVWDEPDTSSW